MFVFEKTNLMSPENVVFLNFQYFFFWKIHLCFVEMNFKESVIVLSKLVINPSDCSIICLLTIYLFICHLFIYHLSIYLSIYHLMPIICLSCICLWVYQVSLYIHNIILSIYSYYYLFLQIDTARSCSRVVH